MTSRIRISLLAAGAVVALGTGAVLYANADNLKKPDVAALGKMTDAERIVRASSELERIKGKPQDVSSVLVSFDNLKDKEYVRELKAKHNAHIKQIYFALPISQGPTTRGGFLPGEDLEAAFKNHEENLMASLQASIDSMRYVTKDEPQFEVVTEKDRVFMQDYEAAKAALRQNEERLAKAKQGGAMYSGVQIELRNDKALELSRMPGIRAVEVVNQKVDLKASPMLPEGISSFTK